VVAVHVPMRRARCSRRPRRCCARAGWRIRDHGQQPHAPAALGHSRTSTANVRASHCAHGRYRLSASFREEGRGGARPRQGDGFHRKPLDDGGAIKVEVPLAVMGLSRGKTIRVVAEAGLCSRKEASFPLNHPWADLRVAVRLTAARRVRPSRGEPAHTGGGG
jgi:hypothetical protein